MNTSKQMRPALIRMQTLQETALNRPPGYLAACLMPPAQIRGKWVIIPAQRYSALRKQFAENKPTITQRVYGLLREIRKWKKAGFGITPMPIFLERNLACAACPFSVREPFAIRTCGRCGCTRAKLFLEQARCPEKKWKR